jgi:hypothetical protein
MAVVAVLLVSLTNTFNFSGIYRNYVVIRDNVGQCISHALNDNTRAVCLTDRPWDLTTPVLEAMANDVSFGRYINFAHAPSDGTTIRIDPASIGVANATDVVATADDLSLTVTNDTVLTLMAPPAIDLNDCQVLAVDAEARSTSQTVMSANAAGLSEQARLLNSPVLIVPEKNPTVAAAYLYAKTGFGGPVQITLSGPGRVSLSDIEVRCQVPIPTDVFVDDFDRRLTTGWSTPGFNDKQWITIGRPGNASVDGSSGVLNVNHDELSTFEYLPFRGEDVTLRATFSLDAIPADSYASVHLWPRVADSVSYRAYVVFKPGGDAELTLAVEGLGRTARAVTVKVADDAAADDVWNVDAATVGVWPTSVYARAWRTGTPEPAWTLQLVDSAVRLQVPADQVSVGLYGSGNLSAPVSARFQTVQIDGRW